MYDLGQADARPHRVQVLRGGLGAAIRTQLGAGATQPARLRLRELKAARGKDVRVPEAGPDAISVRMTETRSAGHDLEERFGHAMLGRDILQVGEVDALALDDVEVSLIDATSRRVDPCWLIVPHAIDLAKASKAGRSGLFDRAQMPRGCRRTCCERTPRAPRFNRRSIRALDAGSPGGMPRC